jgi:microcystin-dependent protein
MSLILPTIGQEPGPNWAQDLNSSLSLVDQHNHASGSGVQITPAGLNINTDLTFNGNNAVNLKSTRFISQISPLASGSDIGCVYVSGADLYYNDTLGNQVRLTIAGAVNGTPGSIGGLVAPATVTYVPANQAYVFQSNVNTSGSIDSGPITLRNNTASSNGITLSPPSPLTGNYTITLPGSTPATTGIVEMSSTGTVSVNTTLYPYFNPVGSVIMFAGTAAPTGWLLCDGSTLDSVANPQYANLFTAIGTTYGGTGASSFKLPDCRGIFVRGAGSQTIGAETYSATIGTSQNDSTAVNGLATSSAGSHDHGGFTGSSAVSYYSYGTGGATPVSTMGAPLNAGIYNTYTLPGSSHSHTISTDGTHTHNLTGDSETRPANLAMNYIIKF